jgi:hypothetical protein
MKAWGNAPGLGIRKTPALKGRDKPKALCRPDGAYKNESLISRALP